mgnify:CR=1 FL=1
MFRGRVLEPVQGWTNHHSITEIDGRWYLFYHDTQLSDRTHLRNVKVNEAGDFYETGHRSADGSLDMEDELLERPLDGHDSLVGAQ